MARANVREGLFDPSTLSPEAKRFAIAYETYKAQRRLMDFDDMLIYAADLMEKHPDIRAGIRAKYDFFQIDEAQDISQTDFRLIRQFGENVFMVGDDDQSIYGFRGGAGDIMQAFAETATQYPVTENFRSTPEIVELGSRLMEGSIAPRLQKDLTSTRETGPAPRHIETTPSTLIENLEKELLEGARIRYWFAPVRNGRCWAICYPSTYGIGCLLSEPCTLSKGLEFDRVIVLLNTLARQGTSLSFLPVSLADTEDIDAAVRRRTQTLVCCHDPCGKRSCDYGEGHEVPARDRVSDSPTLIVRITYQMTNFKDVAQRQLEPSKRIQDGMRGHVPPLPLHTISVCSAYHDLVDMETTGTRYLTIEVIENLNAAQVHREKDRGTW